MRSPLFARTACAAAMLAVLGCAPAPAYKDGVFEAKSPGPFTSEPYLGDAKIVAIEPTKVRVAWDGQEKEFSPIGAGE